MCDCLSHDESVPLSNAEKTLSHLAEGCVRWPNGVYHDAPSLKPCKQPTGCCGGETATATEEGGKQQASLPIDDDDGGGIITTVSGFCATKYASQPCTENWQWMDPL